MNKHLRLWATAILLGCYTTLVIIFLFAYTHGMQVLVTINDYGEANIELLLLISAIPLVIEYALENIKR